MAAFWNRARVLGAAALSCAFACAPPPAAAPSAPQNTAEPETAGGEVGQASTPADTASPAAPAGDAPATASGSSASSSSASDSSQAESSEDDGLDADIAELSASTHTDGMPAVSAPPAPPGDPIAGREIVYRVTPKGLVIEIDGIHLRPEAKPFRRKSGAYGIELVVNAESFDGRQYWLNTPKEGPLSIAGKIEGKGKSSRFADQREGSGEEPVLEGSPHRFEQRWPGRGQPKLWAGQTVTLEVGLWGLRAESERERPVRRLFVVKMVAGPRSQAVITPPTIDWGG